MPHHLRRLERHSGSWFRLASSRQLVPPGALHLRTDAGLYLLGHVERTAWPADLREGWR